MFENTALSSVFIFWPKQTIMTHHLLDLTPEILEFGYYVKYKENVAKY